jgi:hypothetical protein
MRVLYSDDTTPRADKSPEAIDDDICQLLYEYGADMHIDGHEIIAKYVQDAVAAEREACARLMLEMLDGETFAAELAAAIRSRGKA